MAALSLAVEAKRFARDRSGGQRTVLAGIALELEAGERVAVTGPSGVGKSTLLAIAAGLDPAFIGTVQREPGAMGVVFQEPRLLPWLTVEANLRLVLPAEPDPAARIAAALVAVELGEAAGQYASRLSLGMARRVAVARAFVVDPGLVLLDEATASLDPRAAQRLRLLLLGRLEASGAAALIVTHDPVEAVMLAHRVLVLGGAPGRVVATHAVQLDPAARRDPERVAAAAAAFERAAAPARAAA